MCSFFSSSCEGCHNSDIMKETPRRERKENMSLDRVSEAYYTAREARAVLGLNEHTFQTWVKTGRITRTKLPGMGQGVYLKREIDRKARLLESAASRIVTVKLSDCLSDSGTVAVLVATCTADVMHVIELCVSCRALGRRLGIRGICPSWSCPPQEHEYGHTSGSADHL